MEPRRGRGPRQFSEGTARMAATTIDQDAEGFKKRRTPLNLIDHDKTAQCRQSQFRRLQARKVCFVLKIEVMHRTFR